MRKYRCTNFISDNDRKYLEENGVHLCYDPAQLARIETSAWLAREMPALPDDLYLNPP